MSITLRAVTIADPTSGFGDRPVDLDVSSSGVIQEIRPHRTYASRRGDFDATGLFAFPGLIDSHVHLCFDPDRNPEDWLAEATDDDLAELVETNARQTLACGVTTVRDLGSAQDTVRKLKARIQAGNAVGPRVVCAGPAMTVAGGHCYFVGNSVCDGQMDNLIDQHALAGDEWVKFIVTGGMLTRGSDPLSLQFEREAIERAASYARSAGILSAAHVLCTEGMDIAVAARVNTIEHGVGLQPKHAARMIAAGQALVPTLATAYLAMLNESSDEVEDVQQARALRGAHLESVNIAHKAKVTILAGSDAGCPYVQHGHLIEELHQLASAGLDPLTVCRSATADPALVLGLDDVGRIAHGMAADLVLLPGDPHRDLEFLRKPAFVFQRGRCVVTGS